MSYFRDLGQMGVANLRGNFETNCGSTASNFDKVAKDGGQTNQLYNILTIVVIILALIAGVSAFGKDKDGKEVVKDKSVREFSKIIFWGLIISLLPLIIMAIYEYILFSQQWQKWFNQLTPKCQNQWNTMNIISTSLNNLAADAADKN